MPTSTVQIWMLRCNAGFDPQGEFSFVTSSLGGLKMEGVPFLCPHFESCRRLWRGDGWWVTHCPGLPFLVEESETPLGSEAAHPHQAHMHCSLSSRFTDLRHHLQPPSLGEEVLRHSPHSVSDPSGQLDVSQWHPNHFLRIQPAGNRIHTRPLDPPHPTAFQRCSPLQLHPQPSLLSREA